MVEVVLEVAFSWADSGPECCVVCNVYPRLFFVIIYVGDCALVEHAYDFFIFYLLWLRLSLFFSSIIIFLTSS